MKYRVYEVTSVKSDYSTSTFRFLADNKPLAEDHAFFSLSNDDGFVAEYGTPERVKFIGFSSDGTLGETDTIVYI